MAQIQVTDALGRKVYVPEHYMDHPVLSKGFKRLPSSQQGQPTPTYPQGVPTTDWSHAELDAYALAQDPPADLAGATSKADKVSALTSQGG